VLIVGAGPVGLTLAIDLRRRGIACILIEQKPDVISTQDGAMQCTHHEIFRRLGLAEKIRAAGLPSHIPMDVFVILAMMSRGWWTISMRPHVDAPRATSDLTRHIRRTIG
jgi:cation diffusion facilitator CzcD-associated flavoprotein CzcO